MKKRILIIAILASVAFNSNAQNNAVPQFKIITVVESIIPSGIGRSRLIENNTEVNVDDFTTERTDGKRSNQGDIKRRDAKVDKFSESKLLNFFSLTGINFQNIASNDAIISSKINQMAQEGWGLAFVTSGVESDAGGSDGYGLYITRLVFKK